MQRGGKKRKLPCYSEISCRLGRKQHKCSGVRKTHGAGRGKRRHLSRQDENAVLFRQSDWDIIKQVKGAVKIPVIGNGDVVDGESAKAMYEQTGCDLVMIGRGSYGRPWVFRDVKHYLETGEKLPEVTIEEKMAVMKKHCELICKYKGERQGMKEARKNCAWYVKGLKGSARLRAQCGGLNTISDLYEMIDHILANELGE